LRGFIGGFTDGRYGYFVPNYYAGGMYGGYSGKIARVDLNNFTSTGISVFDLTTINPLLVGFIGGFTDGRYGYLLPYYTTKLARIDLNDFNTVSFMELSATNPIFQTEAGMCYGGGFTDGKYGYFAPFYNDGEYQGMIYRIMVSNGCVINGSI
jgi:hypothetical protein